MCDRTALHIFILSQYAARPLAAMLEVGVSRQQRQLLIESPEHKCAGIHG